MKPSEFFWRGVPDGRVRVLVTGVGGNVGQGILKALAASRLASWVVGTDCQPMSVGLFAADRGYVVPRADTGPAFYEALKAIVTGERIQAVLVGADAETLSLSRLRARLEGETGTRVLTADPQVVAQCHDKWRTSRLFRDLGVAHPPTVRCDDRPGLEALWRRTGFPLIVKPRTGFASRGVRTVGDPESLEPAARELGADGIAQPLVGRDDEEYTGVVFSTEPGRVAAALVMRRELVQGTSYRIAPVGDRALTAILAEWGRKVGIRGSANFQFRLGPEGPLCIEVNPRFSGTVGLRYLFGFNDVAMALRHFALGEAPGDPAIVDAVVCRYWNEMFLPGLTWDEGARVRRVEAGRPDPDTGEKG